MYVLDACEYSKWTTLPAAVRCWIRLWLDGTHAGTHVHWRLSPLSVLGLATIWDYFSALEQTYWQRRAIIRIADRRRHCTIYCGTMPATDAPVESWNSFFTTQIERAADITGRVLAWHRDRITDGTLPAVDAPQLWIALNELYATLTFRGYASDDLFSRVKDGVIDASGIKEESDSARLVGFLDYFANPTPREYVVWTMVLADTVWSNTSRRRFSSIQLQHPWDLRGDGPSRVLLQTDHGEKPAIISRLYGTHSIKERHRLAALKQLDDLMRSVPQLGRLSLDGTTQLVLANRTDRPPWQYARRPYAIPLLSDDSSSDADGLRVGQAAQELFDHPERVIAEIFRAWDHSGHSRFWETVPRSYHRLLRSDLRRVINAYRLRLGGIFNSWPVEKIPGEAQVIGDVAAIQDHEELLEHFSGHSNAVDEVFLLRLAEVVRWSHFDANFPAEGKVYNSVHEYADLLTISRGVRNALEHAATVPVELYNVVLYLALVMLHGFSCVVRDYTYDGEVEP